MTDREKRLVSALTQLITVTDTLLELLTERPDVDKALADLHDAAERAREAIATLKEPVSYE